MKELHLCLAHSSFVDTVILADSSPYQKRNSLSFSPWMPFPSSFSDFSVLESCLMNHSGSGMMEAFLPLRALRIWFELCNATSHPGDVEIGITSPCSLFNLLQSQQDMCAMACCRPPPSPLPWGFHQQPLDETVLSEPLFSFSLTREK